MTSELPPPRRRVRTGCLTCRRRRRKCDEARPICHSCRTRSLDCRYGLNIVFMPTKESRKSQAVSLTDSNTSPNDAPISSATATSVAGQSYLPPSPDPPQTPLSPSITDNIDPSLPDKEQPSHQVSEADADQSAGWEVITFESNIHVDAPTTTVSTRAASDSMEIQCVPQSSEQDEDVDLPAEGSISVTQELYELELLHHYLYRLGGILNLGLGNLHYGVQIMLDAQQSPCVQKAVLALSSCHRAATETSHAEMNEIMSQRAAREASETDQALSQSDRWNRFAMTAFTIVLTKNPQLWLEAIHAAVAQIAALPLSPSHRPLLARLILGAIVISGSQNNVDLVHWFLDDSLTVFNIFDTYHAQQELQIVLSLLAESARIGRGAPRHGKELFQTWRMCWRKLGAWYSGRPVAMQEILTLSDGGIDTRVFPFILFSSACAAVANVVYHLAAIVLLQNKPRLIEPSPHRGPSISSTLHALHLMGIADTAAENELWDPIIAVAVVHAAKKLSHHKQRYAAAQVLTKIGKLSGMKLEPYIDDLLSATPT